MNGLRSELLKYRRTFTKKLVILLPLFFVLQAMPSIWLMPKDVVRGWEHVNTMVFNIWTVVFLPLGIALFAYLIDMQERKAGNYRSLRAHAYSPGQIWVNKVTAMVIFTFIATLILFVATTLVSCHYPDPAMGCDVERHVCQHGSGFYRIDDRNVCR